MNSFLEETIESINKQLIRIKELSESYTDQELVTSLSIFNDKVTPVWIRKSAGLLTELTYSLYKPSGRTALWDAIGISISDLKNTIGGEVNNNDASVVVIILTDGYENASTFFTLNQIKEMVTSLEATERWSFNYIGTTFDTYEIAEKLGIKKQSTLLYEFSNTPEIYERISRSLELYMDSKQSGFVDRNIFGNDDDNE